MIRDYVKWDSPALGRPMEMLWFGNWGRPVLMFPTSMGRFYQNEDFGLIHGLADKIDAGQIQVACVDSVDGESWYNGGAHPGWRAFRQDQYDRYVAGEALPYIRSRAGRDDVVVYGASFGAYHAANFTCRHPELVSRLVAFSGLYDIHRFLNGYWDETCYFHCPSAYVSNFPADCIERLSRVGIVIATGEHDSLAEDTRRFSNLLRSKGLPVHSEIWPGVFGHDWPWWIENLRRFLP